MYHAFTPEMKAVPKCRRLNFVAFLNTLFQANSKIALHASLWRRQSHNALQQATHVEHFKWILFSFLGFGNVSRQSWVNFHSDKKKLQQIWVFGGVPFAPIAKEKKKSTIAFL